MRRLTVLVFKATKSWEVEHKCENESMEMWKFVEELTSERNVLETERIK